MKNNNIIKVIAYMILPTISLMIYHYLYYNSINHPIEYQLTLTDIIETYGYLIIVGCLMVFLSHMRLDISKNILLTINVIYIIFFLLILLPSAGINVLPDAIYTLFGYAQNIAALWMGMFIYQIVRLIYSK